MLSSEFMLPAGKFITVEDLAESYAKQIYTRHQLREQKLLSTLNEGDETVQIDFEKIKNIYAIMKDFYHKLGKPIHAKTQFNVDIFSQIDRWKSLMSKHFPGTSAETYVNGALDKIANFAQKYKSNKKLQKIVTWVLIAGLSLFALFGAPVIVLSIAAGVLAFINSFLLGETAGGSILDGGKAALITAIIGSIAHGLEHKISYVGDAIKDAIIKLFKWVIHLFGELGSHQAAHALDVGVTAAIAHAGKPH